MLLMHLLNLILATFVVCNAEQTVMSVQAQTYAKVPLLIGYIPNKKITLFDINTLQKDFAFSNQFDVEVRTFKRAPTKKEMKALAQKGYQLGIFIEDHKKQTDWWLYDMAQVSMLDGKRFHKKGTVARAWSHQIADTIWPILTGSPGIFSTKIAYCKQNGTKHGVALNQVCIADYDGSHEEVLVNVPTVTQVPRWNSYKNKPLIFYSEHTNTNVRLMMVDMHKKRRIASDKDGINMELTSDGKRAIYCASDAEGNSQLYMVENNKLQQLTHYKGNSLSPSISADGTTVYFCSDFKTNSPQIFSYNLVTKDTKQLTSGGFCASPHYCSHTNKLVYSRLVNGVMQLFTYDFANHKHTQLTYDNANKQECAWSACGTYVISSIETPKVQRLALIHIHSCQRTFLTAENVKCSDPAWSGCYQEFPIVMN